jgi:DNA-binding MarR family transcriptional regulator
MSDSKTNLVEALPHQGDESHLVREILRTYQVLISVFARETGLPASRFALMRLLANSERGLGIIDLARQLEINAAAVTRQVQDLEAQSLVRRRADGRDGRRSYVSLSPKGVRLFKQAHDRTHEFERSLSAGVSADEMQSAAKVLAKLRAFVESLNRG